MLFTFFPQPSSAITAVSRNLAIMYGSNIICPHQWLSGSALKTGGREVPGSIPVALVELDCSEFFVIFSEPPVNTG